jgi:hypothetical protein
MEEQGGVGRHPYGLWGAYTGADGGDEVRLRLVPLAVAAGGDDLGHVVDSGMIMHVAA